MGTRFGTITMVKLLFALWSYWGRNRDTIGQDPNVDATLFTQIDTCMNSVVACAEAVRLVLPQGD